MKAIRLIIAALVALPTTLAAQTIWTGPAMAFSKANFADHTLAANQDFLTSNVIITRASSQGIFNIAVESSYVDFQSPTDTEWSFGNTGQIGSLTFEDWESAVNGNPPGMVGAPMVCHLITDDIYIDVTFTQWSAGNGAGGTSGGGFAYTRSTDNTTSVINLAGAPEFTLSPNPAANGLATVVLGDAIHGNISVHVFDVTGKEILTVNEVTKDGDNKITLDLSNEMEGLYFVQLMANNTVMTERLIVK